MRHIEVRGNHNVVGDNNSVLLVESDWGARCEQAARRVNTLIRQRNEQYRFALVVLLGTIFGFGGLMQFFGSPWLVIPTIAGSFFSIVVFKAAEASDAEARRLKNFYGLF